MEGISLVVATLGDHDIRPLMDSLEAQTCNQYECIVIDQSTDRKVESIVSGYRNTRYLHSLRKGNSYNRNIGIGHAKMPIVGFPDDDCYYSADVIEKVVETLHIKQDLAGISGIWMDSITNTLAMGSKVSKYANSFNIWGNITNLTIFLRTEIVREVKGYDEIFGLGSNVFEGGEETDLILKVLENKGRILYVPYIKVWHRQDNYTIDNPMKQRGYEESWGALFGKWSFSGKNGIVVFLVFLFFLLRSLMGSFFWALRGNFNNSKSYLMKNKARLQGWIKYGSFKSSKI